MGLAAELAHGLDDLGHAAAVGRMVVAEPAAVGVERQPTDAGDEIAVSDELAALALLAEAKVLQRHQHSDREAVVDRGVLDVGGLDPGLGEGPGAGPHGAGVREVDLATHLELERLAGADQPHERPLQAARDLWCYHDDGAAAVADHAAVETMERVGDDR